MNLSDIAILSINDVDYCCIINGISKRKAIKFMQNIDLNEKNGTLKNINLLSHVKMGEKIVKIGDIEFQKQKFQHYKNPIFLDGIDIDNVLVSNKISCGKNNYKYFIGYLYVNYKIKPLHIMLPNTRVYVKSYDGQTKWMYFFIEDGDLLERYNTI